MLNKLTSIVKEKSGIYMVKILPPAPTAEFCTSKMDNSTTISTLQLGTLCDNPLFTTAWLELSLLLVLVFAWLVYLP